MNVDKNTDTATAQPSTAHHNEDHDFDILDEDEDDDVESLLQSPNQHSTYNSNQQQASGQLVRRGNESNEGNNRANA